MPRKAELPVLSFATAHDFRRWLEENHPNHPGIWLQIAKKDSGRVSLTYAEALDEALCFGWIDGQKKRHDQATWLQKLTRRQGRSGWSKINTEHVERLTFAGRMRPGGLAAVAAAKADRRWAKAYSSPRAAVVPPDFLRALSRYKRALRFFETLNKANRYAIIYRLNSAKRPETRQRRLEQFVQRMKRGEKLH